MFFLPAAKTLPPTNNKAGKVFSGLLRKRLSFILPPGPACPALKRASQCQCGNAVGETLSFRRRYRPFAPLSPGFLPWTSPQTHPPAVYKVPFSFCPAMKTRTSSAPVPDQRWDNRSEKTGITAGRHYTNRSLQLISNSSTSSMAPYDLHRPFPA